MVRPLINPYQYQFGLVSLLGAEPKPFEWFKMGALDEPLAPVFFKP
jgi:hypothetical protein